MTRMSAKESLRIKDEIINAALRLFSKHGVDAVSVPRVMAEVGQSHGGFYGRFRSKDSLAALAISRLIHTISQQISEAHERGTSIEPSLATPELRALAFLSADAARSEPTSEFRITYQQGVRHLVAMMDKQSAAILMHGSEALAAAIGFAIFTEATSAT